MYVLNLIAFVVEVCLLLKKWVGHINSITEDHAKKFIILYEKTKTINCSKIAFFVKSSFKSSKNK